MTTYYLIRHATIDGFEHRLAGRQADVHLNEAGKSSACELGEWLAGAWIDHIYCSPMERTIETAEAIGEGLGIGVTIAEELNELDFGEWTGKTFQELDADANWLPFNVRRSTVRIPGGESMPEVQLRVVRFMLQLHEERSGDQIALVSHGDVIRAALAYWLGLHLDFLVRLEVNPASVSVVRLGDGGPEVAGFNLGPTR